jgi:Spermine/spermidine synthase domain
MRLVNIKQKGHIMKDIPLSTKNVPFVERLRQLIAVLFQFLDWFTPAHPFIADKRARTFLVSFTMLFFELLCIRWIPSYVRYLSYFNNFLLLASFLGIGLGMLSARRERFWFPPFPVLLALLVVIIAKTKFQLLINSTQVLYFGIADQQSAQAENFLVLPIIFGMVTLCFIPLSRSFGKLFSQLNPLTAYTFDIIGSLAGIAAFSAMSYFSLPPLAWFSILGVLLLLLSAKRTVLLVAVVLAATLIEVGQLQVGAYWSPYYKIVISPAVPNGYSVAVNDIGHQVMTSWPYKEPFYKEVYRIFGSGSFHHALILGAGTGSDTAIALAYGVDSITAVEIDPTIQQLGARLNPDQPYSDPRVHVVINDGRSFLQNTTDHYDLIIFALPDSLTLTSSNTSLRLESFLLTQDALATARTRLTSNGLVVLYNYYRQDWLIQKLANMVGNAFHQQPLVTTYGGWGRAAAIMAGPRLATLPRGEFGTYHEQPVPPGSTYLRILGQGYYPLTSATPATDDWPFLYLQDRSFPTIYILGLAMVALYALIGTVTFAPRKTLRRFDWHMFFLGTAFMLLEVKSLTTFSLLFGSTWLVNSLVFFAILSSVLLAILVNRRFKFKRIGVFYLLLFGVLLLNILLPPDALLLSNPILRYMLASVLAFAPVFLANIIFTNSFRDSETADIAFASNLLGIMVGGGMEYFSMLIGYRLLLIPVIVFYACALLLRLRSRRTPGASDEAAASVPTLISQ